MILVRIGAVLLVFGGGSFLLNAVGQEFRLLSWIDTWGFSTGRLIRFGLIGVGLVLILIGLLQARRARPPQGPALAAPPPGQPGWQPGSPAAPAQPGWQPGPPAAQPPTGWPPSPPVAQPPPGWPLQG